MAPLESSSTAEIADVEPKISSGEWSGTLGVLAPQARARPAQFKPTVDTDDMSEMARSADKVTIMPAGVISTDKSVALVFCGEPCTITHISCIANIYATFGTDLDLSDERTFPVIKNVLSKFAIVIFSPALRSFGIIDSQQLMPLRSTEGVDRYGARSMTQVFKEVVKRDNVVLARIHQLVRSLKTHGTRSILVTMQSFGAATSPSDLDEYLDLTVDESFHHSWVPGCRYDGVANPLFEILTNADISVDKHQCVHRPSCRATPRTWFDVNSVSADARQLRPGHKLLTWLALKSTLSENVKNFVRQDERPQPGLQSTSLRPHVLQEVPVRGHRQLLRPRDQEDDQCIGGLRYAHQAVKRLPYGDYSGKLLAGALDQYLTSTIGIDDSQFLFSLLGGPKVTHTCANLDFTGECVECKLEVISERARIVVLTALCEGQPHPTHHESSDPDVTTHLRHEVFEAWCASSGDPDIYPAKWLIEGAPAGLARMPEHANVFAPVEDDVISHENLEAFNMNEITHTHNVDEHSEQLMFDEVSMLEQKGFVRGFDDAGEVEEYLGQPFYESKLFVLTQIKGDAIKHSVLLDCKRSNVSTSSAKSERVKLPRAMDTVTDILQLSSVGAYWTSDTEVEFEENTSYEIGFMVLDLSDAFWNVPLHPEERRYFVFKCRSRWYVVLRTAQGSRNAPLTWGRLMAQSARAAQSTAPPERMRIETYVDDPLVVMRGVHNERRTMCLRVILVWLALGHRLAWHKGQSGSNISWISVNFSYADHKLVTTVRQGLLDDISDLCDILLKDNVIALTKLRTLVGKAVHVGGLLYMWRPFIAMLWAPLLSTDDPDNAPRNCCWCRRLHIPAMWLKAFLNQSQGSVQRTFDTASFLGAGVPIRITVDASPWGIGGTLAISGEVIAYFYDAVSDDDVAIHGVSRGDHRSQQCLEALSILVALRLWSAHWINQRIQLHVTGDNLAALTLLLELKSTGKTLGIVARELALDIATSVYSPTLVSHIPGVSNVTSDALSRIPMPNSKYEVPSCLKCCKREVCQVRNLDFYKTLTVEKAFRAHPTCSTSNG